MSGELSTIAPSEAGLYDSRLPADLSELPRERLTEWGRRAARAAEMTQWMLGDLACEVETRFGEADLANYADEIGVNYSTLRGYRATSAAFPPDSVGRQTHPFGVYQVLAAQEDRLELVAADPMTVQQARDLVTGRIIKADARRRRKEAKDRKEAKAAKRAKGTRRRTTATPPPRPAPPGQQPPHGSQPPQGPHLVGADDEDDGPEDEAEVTIKLFMPMSDLRNVLWALYLEHPSMVRNAITAATLFELADLQEEAQARAEESLPD